MSQKNYLLSACIASAVAAFSLTATSPAMALTMQECSAKYKAAQAANSLGGMKWNEFRKNECGPDAVAGPEISDHMDDKDVEPAKPTIAAPRGVNFPGKVDTKYSNLSAGKARMKTCVDSYHDNKAKGTLGDLKWIQKGGGYYSLCNARLKGTL